MRQLLLHRAAKPIVWCLSLLPFVWWIWGAATERLGANPAEVMIRSGGDWTLRFLCMTLAITPLRVWTHTPQLVRFRRMLGLFSFFYACLHLLAYAWLDMGLDVGAIAHDVIKRPFILVGFCCWLLLLPLAATSNKRAIRALGGRQWQALHCLVYLIAPLALLHYFWMAGGKNNYGVWTWYAAIFTVLLGWRLQRWLVVKLT